MPNVKSHMPPSYSRVLTARSGFTLVEMSLVMMIVAFVIGGFLIAAEMKTVAGMEGDLSNIQQVISAAKTFEAKFGYLPGDLPDYDGLFTSVITPGLKNGDGDGNVGRVTGDAGGATGYCAAGCWDQGYESTVFWRELAESNLFRIGQFPFNNVAIDTIYYTVSGIGYPATNQNSKYGIAISSVLYANNNNDNGKKNIIVYGAFSQYDGGAQFVAFGSRTSSEYSRFIDLKMDDGKPQTGRVQNRWTMDEVTPTYGADCNDGTNAYPHTNIITQCTLRIETDL